MLSTHTFLRSSASAVRSFSTSSARGTMAKISIIGRLAADPELATSNDGKEYMKYTVGSSYKSGGEDKVSWFRVAAFEAYSKNYLLALRKGTLVYVEGNIRTRILDVEGKSVTSFDIAQRQIYALSRPKSASPEEEGEEEH
ncbi:putative ssDNA binding protein [Tricharina praecox]|uniref:putative ssDNA binding protein n=1 Tax=Tricharina praecox TaxID=43433 RepID=UPI00221F832D|nr:putative ssDNA binding protein [Tricharina praecox]KAI5854628.1 putative ssDNA binding protein [Tricharina praecox]